MTVHLLEAEKARLCGEFLQRISADKQSLAYRDLVNKKYPEFFTASVRNRARRILASETPVRMQRSERYDHDDCLVELLLDQLNEALLLQTVFRQEEVQELVDYSVGLQLEVIVRPRPKLIELLFDSRPKLNHADVLTVVAGFGEDRPFIRQLLTAVSRMTRKPDKKKFTEMAHKAERDVYKVTPVSTLLQEVELLMDFEAALTGKPQPSVRSDLVLTMVKERGLPGLLSGLSEDGREVWSLEELEAALERSILLGSFDLLGAAGAELADTQLDLDLPAAEPALEFAGVNDTPLFGFVPEMEESAKTESTHVLSGHEPASEPLQNAAPEPSLPGSLATAEEEEVLIKNIFRGDKAAYDVFLRRLEMAADRPEATAVIEDMLHQQSVSPDSAEASLLGDLVCKLFQDDNAV